MELDPRSTTAIVPRNLRTCSACVSMRAHTCACVSMRMEVARNLRMRTHTDACSRMRTYGGGKEPADANVDVKEAVLISEVPPALGACGRSCRGSVCVCLRRRHHHHAIGHLRTSAYVSIRQQTSAYAGSMMTKSATFSTSTDPLQRCCSCPAVHHEEHT